MKVKSLFVWQKENESIFSLHNKNKSKFNSILDYFIIVLFGMSFFSIPALSFLPRLNLITWIFTGLLIFCIFLDLFLFGRFRIDFISISLFLFCLSAFFSSFLNGFTGFVFTPFFLSLLTIFIYMFLKDNPVFKMKMSLAAYIGTIIFLFIYIYVYRYELFSLNFERLGGLFGDENDITLFMSFGFVYSIYVLIFEKNKIYKVTALFLTLIFAFCGISSGSKIAILTYIVTVIAVIFLFFGKKKIWISFIVLFSFIVLLVLIFNLPFMKAIQERILDFISTLFGVKISGANSGELSTIFRFEMFVDGIEMFLKKPIFGWGVSGFANFGGFNGGWSHNHISETLCNFGILGTVFFHGGFICYFYNLVRKRNSNTFSLLFIFFFITCMISVALNSQKIYAYFSPIIFIESKCTDLFLLQVERRNTHAVKNC